MFVWRKVSKRHHFVAGGGSPARTERTAHTWWQHEQKKCGENEIKWKRATQSSEWKTQHWHGERLGDTIWPVLMVWLGFPPRCWEQKTKRKKKEKVVGLTGGSFFEGFSRVQEKSNRLWVHSPDTFNRATPQPREVFGRLKGRSLLWLSRREAGLPDCCLTLSLPAVAPYGRGGDGRDGDAADGGRHLHLEHLAAPRLVGGAVRQRVLHGVAELKGGGGGGEATSVVKSGKYRWWCKGFTL